MSFADRSGKTRIPGWWLDAVIPLLEQTKLTYEEIASRATASARRPSPWGAPSISKFKDGVVRTVELCLALSDVLGVPPPFVTCASIEEAHVMQTIAAAFAGAAKARVRPPKTEALAQLDATTNAEIESARLDAARGIGVVSSHHAQKGRRGRNIRSGTGRT